MRRHRYQSNSMLRRLLVFPVLFGFAALAASCGGSDSPASTAQPDAAVRATESTPGASIEAASPSSVDPSRFVFGASPGKPVVYWIHTDW